MTPYLVVFDVDGTLVDSQNHILAAMTRAYTLNDLPVPPRADVLSIVGLSLFEAIQRLSPDLPPEVCHRLVDTYKSGFAELRADRSDLASPLYAHIGDVLAQLSRDPQILLGVATGKSRRGLDHVLRNHDLTGMFLTQQVADHHPSKPHPAMLQAAMDETGVPAGQTVMIGDTVFDMQMARAAGCRSIAVNWGYHGAQALAETAPDAHLECASELPTAIASVLGIKRDE